MNKLIVITGLDGTGTSSVGAALAERRGAILIHTPAEPFRTLRKDVDLAPRDESPAAHYFFYLASLVHADATLIRPGLKQSDVVCVRHLVDTVVSHRVAGLNVEVDYNTGVYELYPPDYIFFLTADEDIRRKRISERGRYDHLDRALDDSPLRQRFLEEFGRLSYMMTTVDTSVSGISEVVSSIVRIMELSN